MWVIHWGLPMRLPWRAWVCPCMARRGGGAAAWVTGVLAAPGTQGSWRLGQQEIWCSRRVWQSVLASTLQYSCLENPPPWQRSLARPQSTGSHRVRRYWSDPACISTRHFLPVAALPQRELNVRLAQLLGLWGPWWCQVCRDTDCLHCRSHGPMRDFSSPL